jgi:hypothetical protein
VGGLFVGCGEFADVLLVGLAVTPRFAHACEQ